LTAALERALAETGICESRANLCAAAVSAHQSWAANLFTLASDLFPKEAVATAVGLGAVVGSLAASAFSRLPVFFLRNKD